MPRWMSVRIATWLQCSKNSRLTERKQLVDAVQTVHRLLEVYGWDGTYEALAAEIVTQFIKNYDSRRERCWIAEKDGARVGAVFVAKASDEIARLRLLHVEPQARGLGIGKRLVEECVRFARHAGYSKMTLWTQSILHAARHLYKQAGFQAVREEHHHSFGQELTAETWELDLRTTT